MGNDDKSRKKEATKTMQFIINQAIILFVSVALLSSSIDASGGIRGGGGRFLSTSVTTNVLEGEYCGSEGQQCAIDGKVKTNGQIRYGHSGSNAYSNWKDIPGNKPFWCQYKYRNDNVGFGMDPKKGSGKECYWRENPSEAEKKANESIKVCAGSGSSCACVGGQARYGKDPDGRWTNWIDVRPGAPGVSDNGSINCVKSSFGNFDPAKGVTKECQCRDIPTLNIPTESVTFDNYDGFWEKSCENCNSFDYKETFTFTEGTEDSVSEAFMEGMSLSLAATIGFEPNEVTGGPSGSVTVSTEIQESYQRETTRIITNSREQSTETSCAVTSCEDGTLFRWMIEGQDIKGRAAQVATCYFVCIPHEDQQSKQLKPVSPLSVCNLFENCLCALAPWLSEEARDAGYDEKLCTAAPTSAPTKAPTSAPTKAPTSAPTKAPVENPDVVVIPDDKVVVSCTDVKCSDGSDGASCGQHGGCCPFLTASNSNNVEDEKCYCGLSYEDAEQNNNPCNYHLLN